MRFEWVGTYNDGTLVCQCAPGHETAFKDVEQGRLIKFGWYVVPDGIVDTEKAIRAGIPMRSFQVSVKPGEKVIAFRRHYVNLREDKVAQYGLGIEGRFVMLIEPDGSMEVE